MPASYEIRFLSEDRVQKFAGSRGNYYELDDGSHLDVQTAPVWCRNCDKITHGEQIEPLAEIDKAIADLHDPNSEQFRFAQRSLFAGMKEIEDLLPKQPKDKFRLDMIDAAQMRRRWRANRVAPPKCIHCGSADLTILPIGQSVVHPSGRGTLVVRFVGMCSTNFNEWFFTPEGDRIPRDTKPTYWHHPALGDDQAMLKKLLPDLFGKGGKSKDVQGGDV